MKIFPSVPPTIAVIGPHAKGILRVVPASENARLECVVNRSEPSPTFKWYRLVGSHWTELFEKVYKSLLYCCSLFSIILFTLINSLI